MIYVTLPQRKKRLLSFYLATEEYIARRFTGHDYFFMWQVSPSVIFGRNQLIENEVNVEYCRNNGIGIFRRKSGGGCVYADMNNIMLSYITKEDNVGLTYNKYINMIVVLLRRLGVNAVAGGRNDIMIDGRKVSGNAFYHIPGRNIVHGTMLYDTNIRNMMGSITPSDEKLLSKGIQSVKQHITLLKDYINIDINTFKSYIRENLCDEEVVLSNRDVANIENIEKEYLSESFIYGKNPKYNIIKKGRIEGVGEFVIRLEMKNNIIKSMDITGDFFIIGDVENGIIQPLRGASLQQETLERVLPSSLDGLIRNLRREDFINLLLEN